MNTIGFPGIGITMNVSRTAFSIFGHDIYRYALCILAGYLAGMFFVSAGAKKRGIQPDVIYDICFWGLIFGLICARIYYCIFDWEAVGGIKGIFRIRDGGIAIYGGIIGAVGAAYVYCRIKKLKALKVFDVMCPGLFIGQIIGRWGNFFNAEVYGKETNSILRMTINGGNGVHPLFLYEGIWNFFGLIILLCLRDKKKADGQPFFFYIMWYSLGRLFLEGMRQSEYILYLIPGILGISQVVAFAGILIGLGGILYLGKKQ